MRARRDHPQRRLFAVVREAAAAFIEDDVLTLCAALAFYTLLSFAPLMVLSVWLASSGGPLEQNSLLDQIGVLAGGEARSAAKVVIDSAATRPTLGSLAGFFGLAVMIAGATTVFAQLQSSLNIIFDVVARPNNAIWMWLRRRLLSVGIIAAFAFVLVVSLIVSAFLGVLLHRNGMVWDVANQITTTAVFAFLFGAMFRYLPDARIPWRFALVGGLVTAVLFALGKWAIGFYLARGDVGGAYGAAGSLAVLLVWVYYSGAIFFVGAELTKAWLDQAGVPAAPTRFGERRTGKHASA